MNNSTAELALQQRQKRPTKYSGPTRCCGVPAQERMGVEPARLELGAESLKGVSHHASAFVAVTIVTTSCGGTATTWLAWPVSWPDSWPESRLLARSAVIRAVSGAGIQGAHFDLLHALEDWAGQRGEPLSPAGHGGVSAPRGGVTAGDPGRICRRTM